MRPLPGFEGTVLVPSGQGRAAIGLAVWRGWLLVAGGVTGRAFVYSASSGELLAFYQLATGQTFINDVVVTGDAAWFTDSLVPALYRVPLAADGRPADPAAVTTLPLTGDIRFQEGFNANGIEAAGGGVLVIVQSNTGKLFSVDPGSGVTREIDLGGAAGPALTPASSRGRCRPGPAHRSPRGHGDLPAVWSMAAPPRPRPVRRDRRAGRPGQWCGLVDCDLVREPTPVPPFSPNLRRDPSVGDAATAPLRPSASATAPSPRCRVGPTKLGWIGRWAGDPTETSMWAWTDP
ncbi:MAG TPA: hypothetical protein VKG45_01735 [Actinomycetes bacterium]|nr:hypothetical protein [Actinomycetes bacterium]